MAVLELPKGTSADSVVGVGLDSCVLRTRHDGIMLVQVGIVYNACLHGLTGPVLQTTDFFYPLVDDPYVQVGRFVEK